ncbi:uncharacterized protein [Paramormyrops kingsleyae]|uniref:uncharacterized protein isoform X2 n=1 Tax=Paramormyrops kingsleyae TaxID=1676925 RepID=UPI003B97CCAF
MIQIKLSVHPFKRSVNTLSGHIFQPVKVNLMSSVDCFASGNLSSASLKGTLTKIQRSRGKARERATAKTPRLPESDCEICRCSPSSGSGSSRTVLRILTACLLSFLSILGSVSVDVSANLESWRDTEAALHQLTSCKTNTILGLIGELQNMWESCVPQRSNATGRSPCIRRPSDTFSVIMHLCKYMPVPHNSQGLPCSAEMNEFCTQLEDILSFIDETEHAGDIGVNATIYSVFILRLLRYWGDPEEDIERVKHSATWADVMSLKLLVGVQELSRQLKGSLPTADEGFRNYFYQSVSTLSFAKYVSENLQTCWMENMSVRLDLTPPHDSPILLPWATWMGQAVIDSLGHMTDWIQNYARSLKERTEDLKRERHLAEDLLHQMLPKSVAKQLRQRKHVKAESYEQVTIFFSDIVGFTAISASCTPLQVVEMLNNLYMCFDTRIESYDVYKVETIGDAYMVVSGLPERNGDKHADEIAKMSLDLVAAVRQVPIPHMPGKRLQLRAGIHTGPCVAGIVGYKMPRYCLFGDTVNTASRMESTSLPQRIHASSDTYLALMKDNAYDLQLRGEIEVKGKGKMNTYWLMGNKNYSVQNDSLVCHWNPSLSRRKKAVADSAVSVARSGSSIAVQSISENANTPVPTPATENTVCVSAQVEHGATEPKAPGSLTAQLHGCDYAATHSSGGGPIEQNTYPPTGDKPDLLPGSVLNT